MALPLKQHDRRPWLVAQLQNEDGSGIDITDALSVDVIVRKAAATAPLFREPCEVLLTQGGGGIPDTYDNGDPVVDLDGWVRYKWAIGDTDDTGSFDVEWEIQWDVNDPQTVPTVGYYNVTIGDDLDAG